MEPPDIAAETDAPTVLIAEDEVLIRFALSDSLLDEGITVIEVGSAAEAIHLLETETDIDLVFTDIRMPGPLDGLDLADWVHHHRPELSVVLTSGEMKRCELTDDNKPFVAKPYDLASVAVYLAAMARAKHTARAQ